MVPFGWGLKLILGEISTFRAPDKHPTIENESRVSLDPLGLGFLLYISSCPTICFVSLMCELYKLSFNLLNFDPLISIVMHTNDRN
jgi:hypothetical protein